MLDFVFNILRLQSGEELISIVGYYQTSVSVHSLVFHLIAQHNASLCLHFFSYSGISSRFFPLPFILMVFCIGSVGGTFCPLQQVLFDIPLSYLLFTFFYFRSWLRVYIFPQHTTRSIDIYPG